MSALLDKLKLYEENYIKLTEKLSNPDVSHNPQKLKEYGKKIAEIEEIVNIVRKYREVLASVKEAEEMLKAEKEEEMRSFLKDELKENNDKKQKLEKKIKLLLTPKDPNDKKNVIVEIRAGAGGDEAALFAEVLYRLYTRYAESRKWKYSVLSSSGLGIGGFKEIIFEIEGEGTYGTMKYESGVHRVQRVPTTESQGRIHTSTATVAVLPEAEEVDVVIDPSDLRVDVFRSSGPGGQSVNTTDSAVRVTYIPTGMVVTCQDEKSQLQNKEKALKILRARIKEAEEEKQMSEQTERRRLQIGTGDRSERIRTYNYPQGRVTDHRINLTLYKLDEILEGDLDQLTDPLKGADNEKKIEKIGA
ncbi:MAG: peptide chain release factor 1 [Actinobacteria bacterium RBG_13_35_12]|jgi:peptide chain release factor 1|nr:MAG: peptide chain release factor 1 [Actinobacteria bacterium RBG_13_35_12]